MVHIRANLIIILSFLLLNPFSALAENLDAHSVDVKGIKLNFSLPSKYEIKEEIYPATSENNTIECTLKKALVMKLGGYSKTFYITIFIPDNFDIIEMSPQELRQSINSIAEDGQNPYGDLKNNEIIEIDNSWGVKAFFQRNFNGPDGKKIETYIIMYWKLFREKGTNRAISAKVQIVAEVDNASIDMLKRTLKINFARLDGVC